jgi:glucose-1-phosphate cytidylyltransferase
VILAGGRGSRLAEETVARPKPMVEIGGKPILWHIMQIYAGHGYKDFLIACGYKGELIKEYFRNAFIHHSDYVIDLKDGSMSVMNPGAIDWRVGVIDTGIDTMTGGRIRRLRNHVGTDAFLMTYGDGVGDIDIPALVAFHRAHGKAATVTAVRPPARFGGLTLAGDAVSRFSEKPQTEEGWINGGFFVFEPRIFDYLDGDDTVLERESMERLADEGELMAYRHRGFWQPMDTQREREMLESMWSSGEAPWLSRA